MVGSLASPVGWGYHVDFSGGSSSDNKLVPSAEMVGRLALTVGWGYHIFLEDRTLMTSWKFYLFRFNIHASFESEKM